MYKDNLDFLGRSCLDIFKSTFNDEVSCPNKLDIKIIKCCLFLKIIASHDVKVELNVKAEIFRLYLSKHARVNLDNVQELIPAV